MTIPHKDPFTLVYLGEYNDLGWPGYEFYNMPMPYTPPPGQRGVLVSTMYNVFDNLGEYFWTNYNAFNWYPLTTPDNLVVLQELKVAGTYYIDPNYYFGTRIYLTFKNGHMECTYPLDTVTAMDPPLHPNGIPYDFTSDTLFEGNYKLYPRWTESYPYDWFNSTVESGDPGTSPYNPQSLESIYNGMPGLFTGFFSFKHSSVPNGMSFVYNYATDERENVPFNPENTSFDYTARFSLKVDSRICCFNEGATISGKIVFKKSYATMTPLSTVGYYAGFSTSWGDPAFHSEVDWSVTLSESNCTESPIEVQEIEIPQEDGFAVYIDDFYITSVTKP